MLMLTLIAENNEKENCDCKRKRWLNARLDLVADLYEILGALNLISSASAAFKLSGEHLKIPNFLPSGAKIDS